MNPGSERAAAREPGPEAARLRQALAGPYAFRSPWKRAAAAALDRAGSLLPRPRPRPADWGRVRRVAVLRTDHLGDLLLLLPFLARLRRALPGARIDLWTGPWGAELAACFPDVDAVRVAQAPWFRRPGPGRGTLAGVVSLARDLARGGYDAAFDPKGDFRHILALTLARVPVRVGFGRTGGGFLLTTRGAWDPDRHESAQSLALADAALVPEAPAARPRLAFPEAAQREAEGLARELGVGPDTALVQVGCGAPARLWPTEHWVRLLEGLGRPVCLLGSSGERDALEDLGRRLRRRPGLAAGRLGLGGLGAFMARAGLFIGVDSGPAHLAAALGLPTLSLFSGTNRAAQWAPQGARVAVLAADPPPCSPCGLGECPYGNACMRALDPDAALAAARKLLEVR